MNKEEFDILVNEILEVPKTEEIYTASSMCAINIDELRKVIDAFNKIPNYNELIKDNNKKAKQISQLTNNWNELEEWCKNNLGYYGEEGIVYKYVLDKMKEIKENNNE